MLRARGLSSFEVGINWFYTMFFINGRNIFKGNDSIYIMEHINEVKNQIREANF